MADIDGPPGASNPFTVERRDGVLHVTARTPPTLRSLGIATAFLFASAQVGIVAPARFWERGGACIALVTVLGIAWVAIVLAFAAHGLTLRTIVQLDGFGLHYQIESCWRRGSQWSLPWAWIGDVRQRGCALRVHFSPDDRAYIAFPIGTRAEQVARVAREIESFRMIGFAGQQE